jgi:hypothetical protein
MLSLAAHSLLLVRDGKDPQGGFATEWGISSWPTQFIVDKKGVLRAIDPKERRALIDQLLAETP